MSDESCEVISTGLDTKSSSNNDISVALKQNGSNNIKKQTKIERFFKQKDEIIQLVLHELKKENGSVEAVQTDKKLKDYQNSRVINYIKLFRHFADNNKPSDQMNSLESPTYNEKDPANDQVNENDELNLSNLDEIGVDLNIDSNPSFKNISKFNNKS